MKKFDEMYLKESTALQIVCRRRLEKTRLNNYSDSASFFSDFEKNFFFYLLEYLQSILVENFQ